MTEKKCIMWMITVVLLLSLQSRALYAGESLLIVADPWPPLAALLGKP